MAQKVVLLVDDEQGFIEPLIDALTHEGYRVVAAANGADGLGLAAKEKPDLAIVDVMMPPGEALEKVTSRQRTGVHVVTQLRKLYPKLPVFCLSVITDDATVRAINATGARFFRKGETSLRHILEMVRAAIATTPGSRATIRRWSG